MNLIELLKSFFSKKSNVYLVVFLAVVGLLSFAFSNQSPSQKPSVEGVEVHFFYLPTCPHCAEQKPIYYKIKEEMKDINFFEHDASTQEGLALFYKMASEAGLDTKSLGVPTIFVGKKALVGFKTHEEILSAINECISECKKGAHETEGKQDASTVLSEYELPFFGRTDLTKISLPLLAVVLGLIDGFNPCAMWVLIYLISVLVEVNDRKRMWLIVGSFLFASGFLYFLFMSAWLNAFLILGYLRIITIIIGLVALGGGILSIRNYFEKKEELSCEVEDEEGKEKTMNKINKIASAPLSLALIASIVALAFAVNAVEFVCSAAIPAVFTQVLSLSSNSVLENYFYIGIYIVFYMLDDIIIFSLATLAIGSGFVQRYSRYCKLGGGIILALLGVILLFAPHLLR